MWPRRLVRSHYFCPVRYALRMSVVCVAAVVWALLGSWSSLRGLLERAPPRGPGIPDPRGKAIKSARCLNRASQCRSVPCSLGIAAPQGPQGPPTSLAELLLRQSVMVELLFPTEGTARQMEIIMIPLRVLSGQGQGNAGSDAYCPGILVRLRADGEDVLLCM